MGQRLQGKEVLFALGSGIADRRRSSIDISLVEVNLKVLDGRVGKSRQPRQRDRMQRPARSSTRGGREVSSVHD